jgi:hypothetical protein
LIQLVRDTHIDDQARYGQGDPVDGAYTDPTQLIPCSRVASALSALCSSHSVIPTNMNTVLSESVSGKQHVSIIQPRDMSRFPATSYAVLEEDGEDQLDGSCEK